MIKRQPTGWEITLARTLIRKYGGANLRALSPGTLADLVKIYYPTIRGRATERLSQEQLYRIAQRLYGEAYEIINNIGARRGIEGRVAS
ncbi:MAG: hypothetical protein AABX71_03185 [Nanoarchaeota archaeon]